MPQIERDLPVVYGFVAAAAGCISQPPMYAFPRLLSWARRRLAEARANDDAKVADCIGSHRDAAENGRWQYELRQERCGDDEGGGLQAKIS